MLVEENNSPDVQFWLPYLTVIRLNLLLSDQNGRTALIYAAEIGRLEVCVRLIELGADFNLADRVSERVSELVK